MKQHPMMFAAICLTTTLAHAQVMDLGVSANGVESLAYGVSDDGGVVAGDVCTSAGGDRYSASCNAARWTELSGWEDLSVGIPYLRASDAVGVSADGQVIAIVAHVNYPYPGGSGTYATGLPYMWKPSTGTVPLARIVDGDTTPHSVSANGEHLFGHAEVPNVGDHWTIWNSSDGTFHSHAKVDGNLTNIAVDASGDETVLAIWSYNSFGNHHAWAISHGGTRLLSVNAAPTAVSRDGSVIVGHIADRAALWRWTGQSWAAELLDPAQTLGPTWARGVSDDGTIFGIGPARPGSTFWWEPTFSWVYKPGVGMVDLVSHMNSLGIDTSLWRSFYINDVTPDGRFLTGTGWRAADGLKRAILIDLGPPEPSGACCQVGACSFVLQGECAALGGVFHAGVECGPDSDSDGLNDACDQCPDSPPESWVNRTTGCPTPRVDLDRDGDVDIDDIGSLCTCASGPSVPHDGSQACQESDIDVDGDVDQSDFALVQRCLSGESILAGLNCYP